MEQFSRNPLKKPALQAFATGPHGLRRPIRPEALREQPEAVQVLRDNLRVDKNRGLIDLLNVLRGQGKCLESGPEAIDRLVVPEGSRLPIPILDITDTSAPDYAGTHARIALTTAHNPVSARFIVRNLAALCPESESFGLSDEERLECIRLHESRHVLQAMSGEDTEFLTEDDLRACGGHPEWLPVAMAGRRGEEALALAQRYFRQRFRNELDAYGWADWPAIRERLAGDPRRLEHARMHIMSTMFRFMVEVTCGCFLDSSGCSWDEFVAGVASDVELLAAGTFLEPSGQTETAIGPADYLRSIRAERGRISNLGLELQDFGQFVSSMKRKGQVGLYGPAAAQARQGAEADATLVGFEVTGDNGTDGTIAAPSLPARLWYRVKTHWLGNCPGEMRYQIVLTSPSGRLRVCGSGIDVRRSDERVPGFSRDSTPFHGFGQYRAQVIVGSKPVAETHFTIVPSATGLRSATSNQCGTNHAQRLCPDG